MRKKTNPLAGFRASDWQGVSISHMLASNTSTKRLFEAHLRQNKKKIARTID
jgi:hypothetical protein